MVIIDSKEKATIRTVARIAGVSHTTVSRALNDSPAVKQKTKDRIRKIANDVGYVPNINARGLANQKSYVIGLYFSDLQLGTSATFLAEIVNEINATLPTEYSVSLNSVENDSALQTVQKYDGIMVVSQAGADDEFINSVVEQNMPIVVINRPISRDDIPNVAVDEYIGGKSITEYAIRLGHKKIAFIRGINGFESTEKRQSGFIDAMTENNILVNKDWILDGDYLPNSGYIAMKKILLGSEKPTAIFCCNDDMAIGAIRACQDMGFKVPEDISIFGYDDIRYSKFLNPALTTVGKPSSSLAKKGTELLTELLSKESNDEKYQQILYEPTIVVRNSVKDLRES